MTAKKQHTLRTALTWFVLLVHLFAGTGMAQGAVICVAQDGHFAVEIPHPKTGCVATQQDSSPAPLGSTLENAPSRGCWDTSIFGAGSHLTLPSGVELDSAALPPMAIFSPPIVAVHPLLFLRSSITPPGLRSACDSLRSVILLV